MSHDRREPSPPPATPRRFVEDPGRIESLVNDLRAGRLSSEALVTRCLERIAEVDPHVQAWCVVDADRALEDARTLDREAAGGRLRGPLHGLPIAVKDIIDVEGLLRRHDALTCEKWSTLDAVGNDAVGNDAVGNDTVGNDTVGNDTVGNMPEAHDFPVNECGADTSVFGQAAL